MSAAFKAIRYCLALDYLKHDFLTILSNAVISSGEMYFQCKILKNGCYVSAYELSL
jgi:hypothetical protein